MNDSARYDTARIQAQVTAVKSQSDFLTTNLAIRGGADERKTLEMIVEIITAFIHKMERQSSGEDETSQMAKFAKAPSQAPAPNQQPPNASHLAPSSAMSTLASLAYSALGSM